MYIVFITLAAACIFYFAVIVAYSGITASFCWIWLLFAAAFAVMAYYAVRARRRKGGMPERLPTFIMTSFAMGAAVIALLMTLVIRQAGCAVEPGNRYVIVLGARVYPDGISKSLKYRLDTAYDYYCSNPETVFILSGGQGEDEVMPEAMAMYNYLHIKGVPEDKLIMELQSQSTFENILNSGRIIDGADGPWAHRTAKTGIITNNYHLLRALKIAGDRDFENVNGIAAPSDRILFVHQCLRECAAIVKDCLLGNFDWNIRKNNTAAGAAP